MLSHLKTCDPFLVNNEIQELLFKVNRLSDDSKNAVILEILSRLDININASAGIIVVRVEQH